MAQRAAHDVQPDAAAQGELGLAVPRAVERNLRDAGQPHQALLRIFVLMPAPRAS